MPGDAAEETVVISVRVAAEILEKFPGVGKILGPLGRGVKSGFSALKDRITRESSLRSLERKNSVIDTLNIAPAELAEFKKDLKFLRVDYGIKFDKGKQEYTIFFAGSSRERINAALERLTEKYVDKRQAPFIDLKNKATEKSRVAERAKEAVKNRGRVKTVGVEH